MILLNPIFDVHIRKVNKIKVSAFAATEKARRSLSDFFKANDFVYSFNRPKLRDLVEYCYKNKLKIHLDDNLRYRDERAED
jgi:hypothetical protein|tara:strand:- start:114 stop:356 length:243 start_codon:yes stop_codon:yes gene_type:complete